jgi:hypothetical protein
MSLAKRVLTGVRGFFRKAALPVLAAISMVGMPGAAWSLSSSHITQGINFGICLLQLSANPIENSASVLLDGNAAGGSYFAGGFRGPGASITASQIANCLETSPGNIIDFSANGADGFYNTDNYIGFSFKLLGATDDYAAGRYEYAITGASVATIIQGAAVKSDQVISFTSTAPAGAVYGGTYTVAATSDSNLTVSFAAAGACSLQGGSTVNFDNVGICTITATQLGNTTYNAAPQKTQQFNIGKATPVISFTDPEDRIYAPDTGFYLSAEVESNAHTVTFASTTVDVCEISGANAVFVYKAGTCIITANYPGNVFYNPAIEVSQSILIAKANQTLSLTNPGSKTYAPDLTVQLIFTSGASTAAVTFASSTEAVCTVDSNAVVTVKKAGDCTITASQAGDNNYNAAEKDVTFNIGKAANQTLALTNPGSKTYAPDLTVQLIFTSGASTAAVTFASSTEAVCTVDNDAKVSVLKAGTCTITANQAGDDNYNAAAQVSQSFEIGKATQTISFTNPGNKTYEPNLTVQLQGDPRFRTH